MIDIRQPNISANSQDQQVLQMRSYLYQLAQQLQWAFNTLPETSGGSAVYQSSHSTAVSTTQKVDPQKTFAALKDLIIKSADIIDAYYDNISSRLNGLYVAQSDFGTYVQKTNQDIEANSTGVNQLFENSQTILVQAKGYADEKSKEVYEVTDVLSGDIDSLERDAGELSQSVKGLKSDATSMNDSINGLTNNVKAAQNDLQKLSEKAESIEETVGSLYATTIETSAYIKTGLLYEDDDGIPVYGLEVGQTNDVNGENVFSKFARFTSDRMSFYDRNDTEVAFVSDYKLHITNAEITGALTLTGKFKIFYDHGLAFQWIGGNS